MATATAAFPQQQDPSDQAVAAASSNSTTTPASAEALSSSPGGWHSSGSIGPFFAVMSILAVLAFISCAIGRAYSRRVDDPNRAPLNSTNWRSVFRWMKERLHELAHGGAEFGSRLKAANFKKRGGGERHSAPGGNDNPPQP